MQLEKRKCCSLIMITLFFCNSVYKVIFCRGIRKCLYVGKGLQFAWYWRHRMTADDIWNKCSKRRNAKKRAVSHFLTMIPIVYEGYSVFKISIQCILFFKYSLFNSPFPTYKRFLTPLQQTAFENIVAKVEIAHNYIAWGLCHAANFSFCHNDFNFIQ